MKAKELKVGDWVVYKDLKTHEDVLFQIERWEGNVACGGQTRLFSNDLTPVPLTKEILEKNGWQWDEVEWVFFCEFCPHVYLAPVGKGFNVVDATGEQLGRINAAVHELQHLLWALGIDDDLRI